ncbi:Fic family protein, partial [Rhizobium sp. TRM95111]|uniref:Fic family protein n=1 Tax=Rhizobium alarense TaxID=2846851 RepID=UPI001F1F9A32
LSAQERESLEGRYTFRRIVELELDPVRGNFDAAHLREINRRIFQDLPGAGLDHVTPGQYRPTVPAGKDWRKQRTLEGRNITTFVAYSPMDKASQNAIEETLKGVEPASLSKLKTAEFTKVIASLYTKLDYLHPFPDGNSRTLRAFTSQLAREAGYELDWSRFNSSEGGRNVLYVARDLSVNRLAMPHIRNDDTRREISLTLDMLDGNRDLSDLLRDAIRPLRSIAFERLPEEQAKKVHPELKYAYDTLDRAGKYAVEKFPDSAQKRQDAQEQARTFVQRRLNEGDTKDFNIKAKEASRTKEAPTRDREK